MVENFFLKKISAKGLAVFRIAYCVNFLFEIVRIFNYRQLYFDTIPYLNTHILDVKLLLLLWMMVIFLIIIGFYTRVAAIINYVFTLVFISSMTTYEYHMIYTYIGINFLLMFLPISKVSSIDYLRKKTEYLNRGFIYINEKVSKINYLLPVFVGIAIVYFDAALMHKMQSQLWLKGLGIWLPSSLPQVTITDLQWILNHEVVVKTLSHLTMIFEFMFIFLFWNKKFRIILLIIGVSLHFGILMMYPIPYFAMGYIAIYVLLIPVAVWGKIKDKLNSKAKKMTLYYNDEIIFSNKFVAYVEFFDVVKNIEILPKSNFLNKDKYDDEFYKEDLFAIDEKGEYYTKVLMLKRIGEVSFVCYVLYILFRFSYFKNDVSKDFLPNSKREKKKFMLVENEASKNKNKYKRIALISFVISVSIFQIQVNHSFFKENHKLTNSINHSLFTYLGIHQHGVFVDSHFKGYNNVYSLRYRGELLPIMNEEGLLDKYISSGSYTNWIWRVNGPYVSAKSNRLRKGFIDYSSFWAHRNKVNLYEKQEFDIVRKKIRVSFEWEQDLLHNNMDSPWGKVGVLTWQNNTPKIIWD